MDTSEQGEVTEQTPLLRAVNSAVNHQHRQNGRDSVAVDAEDGTPAGPDNEADDKPLPVRQILALCYARVLEPIAYFSIFPYINEMVQRNGDLADTDMGFYSGLIESLFSLTQMMVMILWGRAADRWGRKPPMLISLTGVALATSLFGTARSITEMILFRCIAGVFSGSTVTIRTMIAELSTPKTQARAFSWFSFAGNIGIMLGPLVGGALADPARQYPDLFGRYRFFHDYPYALPSFVVGALTLTSVAAVAIFVQETLMRPKKGVNDDCDGEEPTAVAQPGQTSIRTLLRSPGVVLALFLYGYVMLLAYSYTALMPVFWFTSVPLGGLGLTTQQISLLLTLTGFSQAGWTLLALPPLQLRVGTTGVLRLCAAAYPFFLAASPLLALILRTDGEGGRAAFWSLAPPLIAIGSGVSMAFTGIQLAVNDVAPSPDTLGTLNSLALSLSSGVRAFSPALFSSLFALSVRSGLLGGYAIWVLMVALGFGYTALTRVLPDYDETSFPCPVYVPARLSKSTTGTTTTTMGLLDDAATVISARSSHSRRSKSHRSSRHRKSRSRSRSRHRSSKSTVGESKGGGWTSFFTGGGGGEDDDDALSYGDDGRSDYYYRDYRDRDRDRDRGYHGERSRRSSSSKDDDDIWSLFGLLPDLSRSSFLSNLIPGSTTSHRSSSSSYYKRSPRPKFLARLLKKLRRLLRDLQHHMKRHPLRVLALVLMPLLTGGALTAILAKFGLRLPPAVERWLGIAAKSLGMTAGGGAGAGLGLVGEAVKAVSSKAGGKVGSMHWERRVEKTVGKMFS
ncbi:hypothetical protein VTJ49DRAFT_4078 [Mycothermus thermophilus]|uniref:Major facilitator superfamily (MFS) profile domain-containing protein n=1 Tax=Humicola insolens TaxID=85995 RepID=A0ABR3V665_HUMIN